MTASCATASLPLSLMPYLIEKANNKFKVVNKATGRVLGTHKSRFAAQKQINAINASEHGWEPGKK